MTHDAQLNATRFTDVVCTVCGCTCDDLQVDVCNGRLTRVAGACSLAEPWFAAINERESPIATVAGCCVEPEQAYQRAAEILRASRAPLVFGLSRSSTPGQRAAVALAEHLGGTIDTTASVCHGPSIMAIQQVGESTCSLGEVRQRADLVVFWGANPAESHPRHGERYSMEPRGTFLPRGRADRHVVVIDTKPTATSELADEFVQITPGSDFELIWDLRHWLQDRSIAPDKRHGVSRDTLVSLGERWLASRYGVIFFGLGLAQQGIGHANVSGLLQLVAELNAFTRFTARRLRIPGDVTGADCVLCWRTGFPFAVNLARGFPRYNPGEYSANELLERREVDACVLVGTECVPRLSDAARRHLAKIPVIGLEYPHVPLQHRCDVHFSTAIYGIHAPGTTYRMDEVPWALPKLIDSELPTDEVVLQRLLRMASGLC